MMLYTIGLIGTDGASNMKLIREILGTYFPYTLIASRRTASERLAIDIATTDHLTVRVVSEEDKEQEVLSEADLFVILWDKEDQRCHDYIRLSKQLGKPMLLYYIDETKLP